MKRLISNAVVENCSQCTHLDECTVVRNPNKTVYETFEDCSLAPVEVIEKQDCIFRQEIGTNGKICTYAMEDLYDGYCDKCVFDKVIIVKKKREVWRKSNTVFHLDIVRNVGKIFEIELQKSGEVKFSDQRQFKTYQNKFLPYLRKVIKGSNLDLIR